MADCNKCASASSCERVWKGMNNPMCVGLEPIVTNADCIRQMSDEELEKFISEMVDHSPCDMDGCLLREQGCCAWPDMGCDENARVWMQKEAKNDRT